MWNPFKGRRPASSSPPSNRVAVLADLMSKGRFDELDTSLQKIKDEGLAPHEQESWWHMYGTAAFRQGRDREALERFEEGYKRFPTSFQIRFSLGQQYERARRIDEAFGLFDGCGFPDVPAEYVMAQARYAYLWNRYDRGRAYLRSILGAYRQVKILDDHFLYMRGLPFFGRWWACLAAFSALSDDWSEIERVTKDVSIQCREYDFDGVRAELAARRANDLPALITSLEAALERMSSGKTSAGYQRLSLAIARARLAARDAQEAEALLDSVHLTGQDLPWLHDMRVLAQAEIAGRFGRADAESRLQGEFLQRQPLLFEPDHALNFHLLAYQETLKPRYQNRQDR